MTTDEPAVSFRDHMRWLSDLNREIQRERARANFWCWSAAGTWAINLLLSGVVGWLWWGR